VCVCVCYSAATAKSFTDCRQQGDAYNDCGDSAVAVVIKQHAIHTPRQLTGSRLTVTVDTHTCVDIGTALVQVYDDISTVFIDKPISIIPPTAPCLPHTRISHSLSAMQRDEITLAAQINDAPRPSQTNSRLLSVIIIIISSSIQPSSL